MEKMKKTCIPVLLLGLTSAATADVFGPGPGGAIPDNPNPNCTTPPTTVFTSVINVPNAGTVASVNGVTITGTHSWVGDMVVTLTAPNGDDVHLISRTNGPAGGGDSSDFGGPYVYVNAVTAPTFTAAAVLAGGGEPVPAGTYGRETTPPTAVPAADPDTYTVFNGDPVTGNWTLTVGDWCAADTGSIAGWTLDITIAAGPACDGDADGDGDTDVDDLIAVILDWGCVGAPGVCDGDVNNSGATDVDDLIAVILDWGCT
jgi:subtilisin-like proprotein convertase family protein